MENTSRKQFRCDANPRRRPQSDYKEEYLNELWMELKFIDETVLRYSKLRQPTDIFKRTCDNRPKIYQKIAICQLITEEDAACIFAS